VVRIVGDIEDATAMETHQFALRRLRVDVGALVTESAERWSLARPDTTVRVRGTDVRVEAVCDAARVHQVLDNLIANAIKYGDRARPIDIAVATQDDHVEVAVTNEGDGISADELPFVFERYRRTAAARERARGLGLGLYIARGLIAAHGGRLTAHSVPGATTTFRFTIPHQEDSR
jgi:signal transduction histidine kinase